MGLGRSGRIRPGLSGCASRAVGGRTGHRSRESTRRSFGRGRGKRGGVGYAARGAPRRDAGIGVHCGSIRIFANLRAVLIKHIGRIIPECGGGGIIRVGIAAGVEFYPGRVTLKAELPPISRNVLLVTTTSVNSRRSRGETQGHDVVIDFGPYRDRCSQVVHSETAVDRVLLGAPGGKSIHAVGAGQGSGVTGRIEITTDRQVGKGDRGRVPVSDLESHIIVPVRPRTRILGCVIHDLEVQFVGLGQDHRGGQKRNGYGRKP
jgi:hypothetical protein